uniref:Uncharacterized protein n=1 Tax=Rhizophora mucronata TaxID=61149 RepID=A0A2P2PD81_RHIMU
MLWYWHCLGDGSSVLAQVGWLGRAHVLYLGNESSLFCPSC